MNVVCLVSASRIEESFMPNHMVQIEQVRALVEAYQSHYDQYNRNMYNETEVRVDFVNPLFQALGWDVLNERGLPQHLREVKHEATVLVDEDGRKKKKRPDYSFKAGTEQCFFLETKKPAVDILTIADPAFQLRRYGWSGNLSVSILTNFTNLVIYDCSVRPLEDDPANKAVVAHFHYSEYVEKFDEIFSLISKEAVMSGSFVRAFASIDSPLTKEPFDDYFLDQIRDWRNLLSQDLINNNDDLTEDALGIFVQKILNRIVFLRICEDRSFEQYETLRGISSYTQLKDLFIAADRKYDSGLFDLIDEQELHISDEVIVSIFMDLYYPNSSYEFSVVDPFIIGQIYEAFLTEAIIITPDREIATIRKPEAIDSQGAVNTPKNIADFIVEETLAQLYSDKTIGETEDYRIADICCGSGNFLISAFEYIVNYRIEYLRTTSLSDSLRNGYLYMSENERDLNLSFALKRRILVNNIFGVDIDALAVEVAKLSLLLKLLEDVSVDELNDYIATSGQQALPNLNENIKCGNSLVDAKYAEYRPEVLSSVELLQKINLFDWAAEFHNIKFNAIIGNPPYIRVQKMVHYSPEEYQYYKAKGASHFKTASASLLDKYYLFIERGYSLLAEGGVLGYIVPHRFMNTASGEILRKWLSDTNTVRKITHFGTHQVFDSRSTYTCIVMLSATPQDHFEIGFVHDLNRFLFDHTIQYETYPASVLGKAPWVFIPPSVTAALQRVATNCVRLDELTEIFVGLQTSADAIYILNPNHEDNDHVYFIDKDGNPQTIEKAILKKSIYDCTLKKYEAIQHNSYLIFPYKYIDGKPILYSINEMQTIFPHAYRYLNLHKDALAERNMPSRTDENWFAYGRSQSLRRFHAGARLIWPVLSLDSNYVFDDEAIAFTGGGNGPYYGLQVKASTQESIFYIQANLNYWLMEYLVKQSATMHRGDYYSHGKQFVASLPIHRIDFSNPIDIKIHADIVNGVKNIMDLAAQKELSRTKKDKGTLDRAISIVSNRIENTLDTLYGLSAEDRVNV